MNWKEKGKKRHIWKPKLEDDDDDVMSNMLRDAFIMAGFFLSFKYSIQYVYASL